MCIHAICAFILSRFPKCRGCAVIPYLPTENGNHVILGYEKGYTDGTGHGHDPIRICTGKMEQSDNMCFVACAARELREEYTIPFDPSTLLGRITRLSIINGCPIFTVDVTNGTMGGIETYHLIKNRVSENAKKALRGHRSEVSKTFLFCVDDFRSGRKFKSYSEFACAAIAFSFFGTWPPWKACSVHLDDLESSFAKRKTVSVA